MSHHSSPFGLTQYMGHTTLVSTRAFFLSTFIGKRVTEFVDVGSGSHVVHSSSMSDVDELFDDEVDS